MGERRYRRCAVFQANSRVTGVVESLRGPGFAGFGELLDSKRNSMTNSLREVRNRVTVDLTIIGWKVSKRTPVNRVVTPRWVRGEKRVENEESKFPLFKRRGNDSSK